MSRNTAVTTEKTAIKQLKTKTNVEKKICNNDCNSLENNYVKK